MLIIDRKVVLVKGKFFSLKMWEFKKRGYEINKNFLRVWLGKKVQADIWRRYNICEQKGAYSSKQDCHRDTKRLLRNP